MIDTSEKNFEAAIEQDLINNGYKSCSTIDYNPSYCLITKDTLEFIHSTQPKEWHKYTTQFGAESEQKLLKRIAEEIKNRGTLAVLRQGIKANSCNFKLAYFQPVTSMNPDLERLYQANIFSLVRQLRYSEKNNNSLDLVLFLNGLPLFTAELKNPFKGQTVENAVYQYRQNRDPNEPLFTFGVCLSHFAVDPNLVYMTTALKGKNTEFLPFNQGHNNGSGNPPSYSDFSTAYLWQQIWHPESVLDLIQNFITQIEVEDEKKKKTKLLIFPRYHQLDAVRRLLIEAKTQGAGHSYLIQHSAGSGKSNSIAWLAHNLTNLHDSNDCRVFDSVIVITDRKVLDSQLQKVIRQFEQTSGIVENIDKTSRQLKTALESGKNIIVTTLQKFSVIVDQIQQLAGYKFAVIIDEAHTSQSGESSKKLKAVLTATTLEAAEAEDNPEEEDLEDIIIAEAKKRGKIPNLSYFAFTATPKNKTLELFGRQQPDGRFVPFSLYSMRQAIEEGFILDVLANYTTYKTYFELLKTVADDPKYNRSKASKLLRRFVELHPHSIDEKVATIVEHFHSHIADEINGKAKAMIVTASRLHAVRYKVAIDKYIKDNGYPYQTLVAFTCTVKDGLDYTETSMNTASSGTLISENATAETFKQPCYRFLIVANKFQTGFDQPLLAAMYVDKKLGGINAVQTLSRLNRIYPSKTSTFVLDFVNEASEIQQAFETYCDRTVLNQATDPNQLYNLQNLLNNYNIYYQKDIDDFAKIYFNSTSTQDKLYSILNPIVQRFSQTTPEEQIEFRRKLKEYIKLYAFVSQLLPIPDTDLEKFYEFARHLTPILPIKADKLPIEIQQNITLKSYRLQETYTGKIYLSQQEQELSPVKLAQTQSNLTEEIHPLSQIIQEINQRFGTNFSDKERVFIEDLENQLQDNQPLKASCKINSQDKARMTFNEIADNLMQDMIETNFDFYKLFSDNEQFKEMLLNFLFKRYIERINNVDKKEI